MIINFFLIIKQLSTHALKTQEEMKTKLFVQNISRGSLNSGRNMTSDRPKFNLT